MKPDAMMVRVKALRVARLGGMRSPEQVDILGEQIAAAITTALSERDAEWQERLEADTLLSRLTQAERQRDEALGLVARLRWAVREYADTALLDDAEEGRCDCDAETEQCEFCGLREALAAHPEPAEQAVERDNRRTTRPNGWFSYDPEYQGIEWHDTAQSAQEAAEEALEAHRDAADEAWHESVEQVCWGRVEMCATEFAPDPDDPDVVDYELRPIAEQAATDEEPPGCEDCGHPFPAHVPPFDACSVEGCGCESAAGPATPTEEPKP